MLPDTIWDVTGRLRTAMCPNISPHDLLEFPSDKRAREREVQEPCATQRDSDGGTNRQSDLIRRIGALPIGRGKRRPVIPGTSSLSVCACDAPPPPSNLVAYFPAPIA